MVWNEKWRIKAMDTAVCHGIAIMNVYIIMSKMFFI